MSSGPATFTEAAERCAVDPDTAQAAQSAIGNGQVILLGVNGKLASGKDTIAPAVMQRLGAEQPVHEYYARALKDEVDQLIALVRQADGRPAQALHQQTGLPHAACREMADMLADAIASSGAQVSARERTPAMRRVLQYWGSDVRRAADPNYWVKRTLHDVLLHAAEGKSVYITDARFPNEVQWARAVGFTMVRLEVSDEVQAARHLARDGILPDQQALRHPSETSLDGYQGFDLVVDNNGSAEPTIDTISRMLRMRVHQAA